MLLTMFKGVAPRMKLKDINPLNLPHPWAEALRVEMQPYLMKYDLWMESAKDTIELQKNLRRYGMISQPMLTKSLVQLSKIRSGLGDMVAGGQALLDELTLKRLQMTTGLK